MRSIDLGRRIRARAPSGLPRILTRY